MSNLNQNTTSLRAVLDTINALPSKVDTSGTATAADIFTGKTATVNDAKLTGTNPYNAANVDPAVTNALAALVEKGVDTTGAGLAELAGLIAGIEAGGVKVATGTFTPEEDRQVIYNDTLEHNAGFIPKVFLVFPTTSPTAGKDYVISVTFVKAQQNTSGSGVSVGTGFGNSNFHDSYFYHRLASSNTTVFGKNTHNTQYATITAGQYNTGSYFRAGITYQWIAISDWEGVF